MKILILFVLVCNICIGQKNDSTPNLPIYKDAVVYSEVVSVDSATKEELYKRAKAWFKSSQKDSSFIIQSEDKKKGSIKGSAYSFCFFKAKGYAIDCGWFNFSIIILTKDGKYKYLIKDITQSGWRLSSNENGPPNRGNLGSIEGMLKYTAPYKESWSKSSINKSINYFNDNMKKLILDLKKKMSENPPIIQEL